MCLLQSLWPLQIFLWEELTEAQAQALELLVLLSSLYKNLKGFTCPGK